jgi:acetoin utilization deacetylase AcuC-like enzyme
MLKIAWALEYSHPLPEGHRFPMEKYNLLPEQLLFEGTISAHNLFEPVPAPHEAILGIHTAEYLEKLLTLNLSAQEIRKIGFPLSKSLIYREIKIAGGTISCCEYALNYGISLNIAGGTHHAYSDRGEGFCILNDLAIATQYLIKSGMATKVLIVDLDVHQGNGTAKIFENRKDVFTFSVHGKNNYPGHKEKSSLDIPLPDHTSDQEYLNIVEKNLGKILGTFNPDFIFYQCGVDVLKSDKLGKLSLSIQGCKERDKLILNTAHHNHIPLVAAMGGGYSEKISTIVEAHANTFRLAQEIYF